MIGKLFHKIIASRLESYCLSNIIINTSIQKGFLHGINGVMEHIFCVNSIISHAKENGLPLAMTFIDLKNAFGSVPHDLIRDVLSAIRVSSEIQQCISNVHSQLTGSLNAKHWHAVPNFKRSVSRRYTISHHISSCFYSNN